MKKTALIPHGSTSFPTASAGADPAASATLFPIDVIHEFLGLMSDTALAAELRGRGYNVIKTGGEVDVHGAAVITGLSRNTLYKLVQQRLIPHPRYGSRTVRFVVADLKQWVEARRRRGEVRTVPARKTA